MEYIEKPNLFFVYDAKAELQKRICSGQFTIVDDDFATLGFKCGVDYVMDIINEAEVKDVRPVIHAHWKWDEDGMDWGIGAWVCSNCGLTFPITEVALKENAPIRKYANSYYCGCCGAKMDEEMS